MVDISSLPINLLSDVGRIGLALQALGIVVIITIILNILGFVYNRRRLKQIVDIRKDMNRIERKIDSILRKR